MLRERKAEQETFANQPSSPPIFSGWPSSPSVSEINDREQLHTDESDGLDELMKGEKKHKRLLEIVQIANEVCNPGRVASSCESDGNWKALAVGERCR